MFILLLFMKTSGPHFPGKMKPSPLLKGLGTTSDDSLVGALRALGLERQPAKGEPRVIILGNSHVTVFRDGCVLPRRLSEDVPVHWLALDIQDFEVCNVRAERVKELFALESGWKLLMIHFTVRDSVRVLRASRESSLEEALEARLALWQRHFSELAGHHRFAWMVGMLQVKDVPEDIPEPEMVSTCTELTKRMTHWCRANGIPVINPLRELSAEEGRPPVELLMPDREHLRPCCAPAYFNEIEAQIGEVVASKSRPAEPPWPLGDGLCKWHISQIFEELGIPIEAPRWLPPEEFETKMCAFLEERLAERGIEMPIEPETDFVADCLFDSLSLVENMTYATELLGIDIPFDINLWKLETVRKLRDHLYSKIPRTAETPLAQSTFVASAFARAAAYGDTAAAADRLISRMGIRRLIGLYENALCLMEAWPFLRPVLPYWLALAERQLGRDDWALQILEQHGEAISFHATDLAACVPATIQSLREDRTVEWSLPDAKGFNIVCVPEEKSGVLSDWLAAYAEAFEPDEDVALFVVSPRSEAEVMEEISRASAKRGIDLETCPDIVVIADPEVDYKGPLKAADLVLGSVEACAHARHLGRPAFEAPAQSLLRQALASFQSLPWSRWLADDAPDVPTEGVPSEAISKALALPTRRYYLKQAQALRTLPPFDAVQSGLFENPVGV